MNLQRRTWIVKFSAAKKEYIVDAIILYWTMLVGTKFRAIKYFREPKLLELIKLDYNIINPFSHRLWLEN